MTSEQETLELFDQVDNFLQSKINKSKCILIVGARNSGKTCLIKYFSGVAFTRDNNEEDLPFLVQNTEVVPGTQPQFFSHPKLSIELTILRVNDPNNGDEVAIIEMPSLSSVSLDSPESKDTQTLLTSILFNIYIWDTVLSLAKQIHICLINPYEFITDDHKLTQFFGIWQEIVTKNEQAREIIKQSISIIFTKPEYEDDKQSLITSLQHLSQAGHEIISDNNTFSQATENRVFCFLGQDTEQGQGQELLNSIMVEASYYEAAADSLLSRQWSQNYLWHFLKDVKEDELKQIFSLSQLLFKKFLQVQRFCQVFFDKSLALVGIATILGFINSLPKQSGLKPKQKQLQAELKSKTKFQSQVIVENLLSIQKKSSKAENYLQFLSNLNNLIQKNTKAPIPFEQHINQAVEIYWRQFNLGDNSQKILSNWLQQRASLWKFPTVFWKLCLRHKENHELQAGAHSMEDLTKSMSKKFASLIKSKLTSGVKHYQIFSKVNQIKSFSESKLYKEVLQGFGFDEGEGEDLIVEQQEATVPSDPRIKRWYYKVDENADLYGEIKEKAKKIVIKSNTKGQQVNEREYIKNLFSSIERQQETRNKSLQLLAKKFIQFRLYQSALQVYMDLGDSLQLYNFLTQVYFSYLDQEEKDPLFDHMQSTLIPYLEEKATLYSDMSSANYFLISAHCCYDYIAAKLAESSDEYCQMLEVSNQIQVPCEEKVLDSTELTKIENGNRKSQNNELQVLKYVSFSKAEAIEKVYELDQKCKKNGLLFSQIRKYMDAAQSQLKAK